MSLSLYWLSYYRLSLYGPGRELRYGNLSTGSLTTGALGWPGGPLARKPPDAALAGGIAQTVGLGWPGGSSRELRGVQVDEGRSATEASRFLVPGCPPATMLTGPEPALTSGTAPVVVPQVPPNPAETSDSTGCRGRDRRAGQG